LLRTSTNTQEGDYLKIKYTKIKHPAFHRLLQHLLYEKAPR